MRLSNLLRMIRLGLKSLLNHRLQSFLTMLGVVFGVGSVVAMLSVGEGASRSAQEQLQKLGSLNLILESVRPEEDTKQDRGQGRSRTLTYGLLYADLERMLKYPAVECAAPVKIYREQARLGRHMVSARILGVTPDWFDLVQREVIAGRVFDRADVDRHDAVCLLAEHLARELLATEHTIGQTVTLGQDAYTVIGIVRTEAGGAGVQLPDRDNDAYIPLSVFQERIGDTTTQRSSGSFQRETVELHQVILQVGATPGVAAIDNVEPTAEAVRTGLTRFHDNKDFEVSVPLALLRQVRETQRIFSIVLGSIAGISLLVGGIGIMNIMLASVTERTKEIGLRRAIGAKRKHIIGQFLVETTVLSVTGGIIGVLMGVGIPLLIERYADMPTLVTAWSVLLALGISVAVGIVFGLYPAYRAASLDPIVALRHE